eukprot:2546640-Amphidinium_carterae.1
MTASLAPEVEEARRTMAAEPTVASVAGVLPKIPVWRDNLRRGACNFSLSLHGTDDAWQPMCGVCVCIHEGACSEVEQQAADILKTAARRSAELSSEALQPLCAALAEAAKLMSELEPWHAKACTALEDAEMKAAEVAVIKSVEELKDKVCDATIAKVLCQWEASKKVPGSTPKTAVWECVVFAEQTLTQQFSAEKALAGDVALRMGKMASALLEGLDNVEVMKKKLEFIGTSMACLAALQNFTKATDAEVIANLALLDAVLKTVGDATPVSLDSLNEGDRTIFQTWLDENSTTAWSTKVAKNVDEQKRRFLGLVVKTLSSEVESIKPLASGGENKSWKAAAPLTSGPIAKQLAGSFKVIREDTLLHRESIVLSVFPAKPCKGYSSMWVSWALYQATSTSNLSSEMWTFRRSLDGLWEIPKVRALLERMDLEETAFPNIYKEAIEVAATLSVTCGEGLLIAVLEDKSKSLKDKQHRIEVSLNVMRSQAKAYGTQVLEKLHPLVYTKANHMLLS